MFSRRRITIALIGLVLVAGVGWLGHDLSAHQVSEPPRGATDQALVLDLPGSRSGLPVRPMSALPLQVAATYRLVRAGGPFPYPAHDGAVFGDLERSLPVEPANYYREYTVPTPGAADRGARRLIVGARGEVYYTPDHYRSFVVVDPTR